MTLREFLKSRERLAIQCATELQAEALCEKFDKKNLRWAANTSYLDKTYWSEHKENTVYTNNRHFSSVECAEQAGYKIIKFANLYDKFVDKIIKEESKK